MLINSRAKQISALRPITKRTMHIPPHHAEHRTPILEEFIRSNPLGILTTAIRSPSFPLLQSSHIPWVIDSAEQTGTAYGKLRGHIARQNPQSKAIIEAVSESTDDDHDPALLEEEVLILFNAPHHHYITAKFYKETKPETGKIVPTWDYEAVQVYGKAKVFVDARSEASGTFLARQLSDLTLHVETSIMGYDDGSGDSDKEPPWTMAEAPESYVAMLKKNIIGIEVDITSMAGRWKMSQEKKKGDRDGIIDGIRNLESPIGVPMSEMLARRAAEFDRCAKGG
ncbi:putative transcriptional regulator [Pleomassaria siparia CBS 279.74]|uniref:Putative transcriptional regulator n=1 Tax=Pleomassaria siparia CBS 279.74 TaxID=1314801 RepID=A0A6G1KD83_9PLEO|nr:putative transcriptional regulator [Pleomassaria siparia CBS 279.74]